MEQALSTKYGGNNCPGSSKPPIIWSAVQVSETRFTPVFSFREEPEVEYESTRKAVSEIRMNSGLTWEQLADVFQVSRRSVHLWANGNRLSPENTNVLKSVLGLLRFARRRLVSLTRAALLEGAEGRRPYDLMVKHQFDEAKRILGSGDWQEPRVPGELSQEAKDLLKPLPIEVLFNQKHDSVHKDIGQVRSRKLSRGKKSK